MVQIPTIPQIALPIALAVVLSLGGCAQHFVPGPGMTPMDLSMASGQCGVASRNHVSGFAAAGRPAAVAIIAVGSLLLDAARTGSDFNDCMLAMGAVPDDGKSGPAGPLLAQGYAPVPVTQAPLPPGVQPSIGAAMVRPVSSYGPVPLQDATYGMPYYLGSYAPDPARADLSRQAIDRGDSWMRTQTVLKQGDAKSRDLYLVLCGGGDDSSCVMAAALNAKR